jgi:hypothetical protein
MPESDVRADATVAEWRAAAESLDAGRAVACLAADVVLISPLTSRFTFQGRDQVGNVLAAAYEVIHQIRFHTEVGDARTRALFYHGACGRQAFEESQLLRLDNTGLISELTFFGRPLPGLTGVMRRIAPAILRRQGQDGLARVIGLATGPLHGLTSSGEKYLMPLAAPGGGRPRPWTPLPMPRTRAADPRL